MTLDENGLLLVTDSALPSVVGLIAGKVRGSWWAHEKSREIYGILERLESDPDATIVKLVSGKLTFIHRRLWSDLLVVCKGKEEWQTGDLSPLARGLLAMVEKEGEVRTDRIPKYRNRKALSKAVHALENNLLVFSEDIHTETGAHAKILRSSAAWSSARRFTTNGKQVAEAKKNFEELIARLNERFRGKGSLPWQRVLDIS